MWEKIWRIKYMLFIWIQLRHYFLFSSYYYTAGKRKQKYDLIIVHRVFFLSHSLPVKLCKMQ